VFLLLAASSVPKVKCRNCGIEFSPSNTHVCQVRGECVRCRGEVRNDSHSHVCELGQTVGCPAQQGSRECLEFVCKSSEKQAFSTWRDFCKKQRQGEPESHGDAFHWMIPNTINNKELVVGEQLESHVAYSALEFFLSLPLSSAGIAFRLSKGKVRTIKAGAANWTVRLSRAKELINVTANDALVFLEDGDVIELETAAQHWRIVYRNWKQVEEHAKLEEAKFKASANYAKDPVDEDAVRCMAQLGLMADEKQCKEFAKWRAEIMRVVTLRYPPLGQTQFANVDSKGFKLWRPKDPPHPHKFEGIRRVFDFLRSAGVLHDLVAIDDKNDNDDVVVNWFAWICVAVSRVSRKQACGGADRTSVLGLAACWGVPWLANDALLKMPPHKDGESARTKLFALHARRGGEIGKIVAKWEENASAFLHHVAESSSTCLKLETKSSTTLARSLECFKEIGTMSRKQHCKIVHTGMGWLITAEANKREKCGVNGKWLERDRLLYHGDRVLIGDCYNGVELRFECHEGCWEQLPETQHFADMLGAVLLAGERAKNYKNDAAEFLSALADESNDMKRALANLGYALMLTHGNPDMYPFWLEQGNGVPDELMQKEQGQAEGLRQCLWAVRNCDAHRGTAYARGEEKVAWLKMLPRGLSWMIAVIAVQLMPESYAPFRPWKKSF
jgi:hypothetical protein